MIVLVTVGAGNGEAGGDEGVSAAGTMLFVTSVVLRTVSVESVGVRPDDVLMLGIDSSIIVLNATRTS
jgi:hypothetical protein